MYFGMLN